MRLLFVTGMFRSGTTLLGRMLNAHPQLAVASDPYMPFFKSFRSAAAAGSGQDISPSAPLDDYYFRPNAISVFRAVQNGSLELELTPRALDDLREGVVRHAGPYSPLIVPLAGQIEGNTYRQALDGMLAILARCYGESGSAYLGFKEVWTDEFIPVLARAFPEARFIQIVRDPRAVAASKNVTDEQYPWLFLGRQWRKLAALAHAYPLDPEFGRRVRCVRYEDLIERPDDAMRAICGFLGIEPRQEMIDPRRYVDGAGNPWNQNSSFGGSRQGFDRGGIDRWRDVLGKGEQKYLEMLCGPEMTLHQYPCEGAGAEDREVQPGQVPRVDDARLAAWIRGLYPNDTLSLSVETQKESLRAQLLALPGPDAVDSDLIEGCFLHSSVFRDAGRPVASG